MFTLRSSLEFKYVMNWSSGVASGSVSPLVNIPSSLLQSKYSLRTLDAMHRSEVFISS
ncbi:hypothetical protein Bpfe_008255, partial [Biomphalaria pfeifferi]